MLQVRELSKRFGDLVAVADVSFEIKAGEIVGLLGPNGAGKSTTVSMICGLLRPDSGSVCFEGRAVGSSASPLKRRLGLVPQELALVEELSARANLRFFGSLLGLSGQGLRKAVSEALTLVGLADRATTAVRTFSGGMKRRLNLAAALLHDPQLIVLDEPTVGVDPQSRNAIFEGLEGLRDRGKALLYTTHYMEEAERLCDRIVILDHGRVIANGTVRTLATQVGARDLLTLELDDPAPGVWLDAVRALSEVVSADLDGPRLLIELRHRRALTSVLLCLDAHEKTVTHLESAKADLASIFLSLTGRSLRDA